MKKKLKRCLIIICLSPLLLAVLAIAGLLAFELTQYTLIADVQEFYSDVEKSDKTEYGASLFQTRSCNGCHRSTNEGLPMIGPNLGGIGNRQTPDYIRESIVNPKAVIVSRSDGNPYPSDSMPAFGEILDSEQVDALVAYLSTL